MKDKQSPSRLFFGFRCRLVLHPLTSPTTRPWGRMTEASRLLAPSFSTARAKIKPPGQPAQGQALRVFDEKFIGSSMDI
jgi:hypothetical protein